MKRYKVKTLHIGGLGNKVFNHGDTVTERNFPKGNADLLVKSGHLEYIDEVADPTSVIKDESKAAVAKFEAAVTQAGELLNAGDLEGAKAAAEEAKALNSESEVVSRIFEAIQDKENAINSVNGNGVPVAGDFIDDGNLKAYEDITEPELKAILKGREVSFNDNSKKKYLYKLYSESMNKAVNAAK